MNELRKDANESGLLQTEIWEREINDNQIDHFGALLQNAETKRSKNNNDGTAACTCPHRTDRLSFVSRRSIFNQPRISEKCAACQAAEMEKQDYDMSEPDGKVSPAGEPIINRSLLPVTDKPIDTDDIDLKDDGLSYSKDDVTEIKMFTPTII